MLCNDPAAVEAAVRRQMDRLDQYSLHPDRVKRNAAQDIMNQLAMARVCLVNPKRKKAYDASLRASGLAPAAAPSSAAPARPVQAAPVPAAGFAQLRQEAEAVGRSLAARRKDFERKVRRHLLKWQLDPHEHLLLVAEAAGLGIGETDARAMIDRIDRQSERIAQRKAQRQARLLVGGGLAAAVIVGAAIVGTYVWRTGRESVFAEHMDAARRHLKAGALDKAQAELNAARGLFGDDEEAVKLGRELKNAGHFAAAREAIKNSRYAEAHKEIVSADARLSGPLRTAVSLYMEMAAHAMQTWDYTNAAKALEKAEQLAPSAVEPNRYRRRIAARLVEAGRRQARDAKKREDALKTVATLLQWSPSQGRVLARDVRMVFARRAIDRKDYDAAAKELAEVQKVAPHDTELQRLRADTTTQLLSLAEGHVSAGRVQEALGTLDAAAALAPGDPRFRNVRDVVAGLLMDRLKQDLAGGRCADAHNGLLQLTRLKLREAEARRLVEERRDALRVDCRQAFRKSDWAKFKKLATAVLALAGEGASLPNLVVPRPVSVAGAADVARQMLEAGKAMQAGKRADLARSLAGRAYAEAARGVAGYSTAIEAAEFRASLATSDEDRAAWTGKVLPLVAGRFRAADDAEKKRQAPGLLRRLTEVAETARRAGKLDAAASQLAVAREVALLVSPVDPSGVYQAYQKTQHACGVDRRIADSTAALKKDPKDIKAARTLFRLYFVEKNDSKKAFAYATSDKGITRYVTLLGKREKTADDCLRLARWYQGLAKHASTYTQPAMLAAAKKYSGLAETLMLKLGSDLTLALVPVPVEGKVAYYLGQTEVTNAQWSAAMAGVRIRSASKEPNAPAGGVTWLQAKEFCWRVGRLNAGRRVRLPSPDEWQRAVLSGVRTTPAGRVQANAVGLQDLSGNKLEWTDQRSGAKVVMVGGEWVADKVKQKAVNVRKTATKPTWGFRVLVEAK